MERASDIFYEDRNLLREPGRELKKAGEHQPPRFMRLCLGSQRSDTSPKDRAFAAAWVRLVTPNLP